MGCGIAGSERISHRDEFDVEGVCYSLHQIHP
jgi:hypothetical protein